MRLTPAHVRDAKEMARALCDALQQLAVPLDWRDPSSEPPSLQQTQELMAKAMGYGSWHELDKVLREPHEAVYIDGPSMEESTRRLQSLVESMSALMGIEYAHGAVLNAIYNAGTGMSPRARRQFAEASSPWGPILESRELADGITVVTTESHGGWLLSEERQRRMPAHLRLDDGAYEEDGEYHLVVLGFPEEAEAFGCRLWDALTYMGVVAADTARLAHSRAMTKRLNEAAQSGESLVGVAAEPYRPRRLDEFEERVIRFLAQCVYENRQPIRVPEGPDNGYPESLRCPTLSDWVALLRTQPSANGRWATRPQPWRGNWSWQIRSEEDQAARDAHFELQIEETARRKPKRVPKAMMPLMEMARSDEKSPTELRAALKKHGRAQLERNGFHLIQALSSNSDLAVTSMKFACIHDALGSHAGVIWGPMSSHMLRSDGELGQLTDEQACRFATYVLDELGVRPFPGLIYMACRFGWVECAKLLKERGVYQPLAWTGFAIDTDRDRERLVSLLLSIVQPSVEDIKLIRSGFKDGEPAAMILDRAMAKETPPPSA